MLALIRCASCGSPNVMLDSKKEGYNVTKGIVGTALAGAPGALLGTDGKKTYTYHCPDCGMVLSYRMDDETTSKISTAIFLYEKTGQVDIFLPDYKRRFKNIEWEDPNLQSNPTSSKEITATQAEEEILTYLNKIGTIANYDTLISQTEEKLGLSNTSLTVIHAVRDLLKSGKIALEKIDDTSYLRLVTDINEVRELSKKYKARDKAPVYVKKNGPELEKLLVEKLGANINYSINDIETAIRELFKTNITEDNPYVIEEFVPAFVYSMKERFALQKSGENFYVLEFDEAEKLRQEKSREIEKARLEAEKKEQEERKAKEDVFIEFLAQHPNETFTISEMLDKNNLSEVFASKNIKMSNMMASATLKHLVETNTVERNIYGKKAYFGTPGADERRLQLEANEKSYSEAIDCMKQSNSESGYKTAAEMFSNVQGYKDSDKYQKECLELAESARIKAETERIETEKKKAEKKKKAKKFTVIALIIVIVACAGIFAGMTIAKKNSIEELSQIRNSLPQNTIAASGYSSVALKSDGMVVAVGANGSGQCNVGKWKDIIAVETGLYGNTFGIKSDGTVVVAGEDYCGETNVSTWKNIIAISSSECHTVGLKADGTVIATGSNDSNQCDVSDWKDIIAVSAGEFHTLGLKSDGTVVATGSNGKNQRDVSDWKDIVAISAGDRHSVGLKQDGTVVATQFSADDSWLDKGQCNVEKWEDIIAISAGPESTVALKSDGTVISTGRELGGNRKKGIRSWSNIIAIDASPYTTLGLKSDGTVVAVGANKYNQCEVNNWTNICITPFAK